MDTNHEVVQVRGEVGMSQSVQKPLQRILSWIWLQEEDRVQKDRRERNFFRRIEYVHKQETEYSFTSQLNAPPLAGASLGCPIYLFVYHRFY